MDEQIVVVEYNPIWPRMYEEEKERILEAIGERILGIEHVGSTSVPGLGAKPIIDIMVGVEKLDDAAHCIPPIEALGYTYVPEFEAQMPERRYFRRGVPRSHHVHLVEVGSDFWVKHLIFRDYLRAHPEAAREYFELKKRLAVQYGCDREGYTEAKSDFINGLLEKAVAENAGSELAQP